MMQVNLVDQQQQSLQPIKNSWQSFFKRYFNTNSLKLAILFSLPIYLSIFGDNIEVKIDKSAVARKLNDEKA